MNVIMLRDQSSKTSIIKCFFISTSLQLLLFVAQFLLSKIRFSLKLARKNIGVEEEEK